MAFGPDDMKPPRRHDLFVLLPDLLAELFDECLSQFLLRVGVIPVFHFLFRQTLGQVLGVAAEHDVGPAAGHVGGDGDGLVAAGLGDDVGLQFMEFGVQDLMRNAILFEHPGEDLGFFNRDGPHQGGLSFAMTLFDLGDHRLKFFLPGLVNAIRVILPLQSLIGGDHNAVQIVDLLELVGLGVGGARHAGQFGVHPEIILKGDGRERLVFPLDLDALFRLHGLVQSVGPAPSRHEASGELIDDDHLIVPHHVIDVDGEKLLGLQRLQDMMTVFDGVHLVHVRDTKQSCRLFFAGFRKRNRL